MFKFLHAADIHLDSPLRGLERYEGAPVDMMRHATRRALENLVDLAIEQSVAFVLIAGDLYDGDWREFRTGLFFVSQMVRLRDARIPAFVIAGNHDAANKMTVRLPLPENVRLLSHRKPETASIEDIEVTIHGQSFAQAAVLENLAADYPPPVPGTFNIGLLHTCAGGREGHQRYAPCSLDELRSKAYGYWALGHVHRREVLSEDPPIIFSGNLQGRHIREPGPKGCIVVTVDDDHRVKSAFHALDVLRWEMCTVDAARLLTLDDVLDGVRSRLEELTRQADGRPLAVRVRLVGPSPAHRLLATEPHRLTNAVRAVAQATAAGDVWVEKVLEETTPEKSADRAAMGDGPIAELMGYIDELKGDPDLLNALAEEFSTLVSRLPLELREGPDALELDRPEPLQAVLERVEGLLVQRLLGQEDH